MSKPIHFIDLAKMPDADLSVKNGMDSVSVGLIEESSIYVPNTVWETEHLPSLLASFRPIPICKEHGAINKVSASGIWRCLMCNIGCWEVA